MDSANWPERIRLVRKNTSMSQKQFAESLGCSTYSVNRWESAAHHPGIVWQKKIKKLEDECDLGYLIKRI